MAKLLVTVIRVYVKSMHCKNKITHDSRLHKPCISRILLTPPQERLTGVKLGQQIHRELALCIQLYVQGYRSTADTLYMGVTW